MKNRQAKTQHRIHKIAKNVRKWAEELQYRDGFWDNNLGSMCGIASYELFKRLQRAKLKPMMCFAEGHAFVQCKGLVVDITATQFRKLNQDGVYCLRWEPIEIRRVKEIPKAAWFWKPIYKTKDKNRIIGEVRNWPHDQIHSELIATLKPNS